MQALYRAHGPVNLVRMNQLIDLVGAPSMRFEGYEPGWPQQLVPGQSFFERLRQGDVLIHQPYETFDAVLAFLREAVHDPSVLAIKQTIYRTGAQSELMELLREAVRRGKEVTAVVELKARFDEEANINYAERLESVGAQVVYGVVGLKTHAKMLLVTRARRQQAGALCAFVYGQLQPRHGQAVHRHQPPHGRPGADARCGAGVLAPGEPKQVAQAEQGAHCTVSFAQGHLVAYRGVLPCGVGRATGCHHAENERADRRGPVARAGARFAVWGEGGRNCSGACILPAGVPGVTDNVRVRSVIGRMLEHSRVFRSQIGDDDQVWLSSADWMNRNMSRRGDGVASNLPC